MREVTLSVIMQVDADIDISAETAAEIAVEGVDEALKFAMNRGFNHGFTDIASLGYVSTDLAASEKQVCDICHGKFEELEPVMALDGQDRSQPMGLIYVCDHCLGEHCCAPGWGWTNDYNDPNFYEFVNGHWVYTYGDDDE